MNRKDYNKTICCIFNYAPHYRRVIYQMMDNELSCDFYFGDKTKADLEKFDISILNNSAELKSIWFFKKIYWLKGSVRLIFRPYCKYIMTGQANCLSNWLILIIGKLLGKQIYFWNHGIYGKETKIRLKLFKFYLSFVSGIFLYGNYARELLSEIGIEESRLFVVHNSLDYEQTIKVRRDLKRSNLFKSKFGNDAPVILFIGRLQAIKKLDLLIAAVENLKRRGRIQNLLIIGEGSEKHNLEALVCEKDLSDNVWFYGPCYDESTTGMLIYNSDLCISPGNVGLTCIHSLSYGTPVMTHDDFRFQMPEFEAIKPGITGTFFKADNLESLENEIESWFSIHPVKSDEQIKHCYEIIDEKYNPFHQIQILKAVLKQ